MKGKPKTLRLEPDTEKKVKREAKYAGISFNSFGERAFRNEADRMEQERKNK